MDKKPTLHLLMGLPGAGKTTLARMIETLTGAERLSSDEYRLRMFEKPTFTESEHDALYLELNALTEKELAAGKDVIYDANLNRLVHRQEKYDLAAKYRAHVVLWWVCTPKDLSKRRRLDEQHHLLLPDGESSERMFDRIASVLEEPQAHEFFTQIDGTNITESIITKKLEEFNQASA